MTLIPILGESLLIRQWKSQKVGREEEKKMQKSTLGRKWWHRNAVGGVENPGGHYRSDLTPWVALSKSKAALRASLPPMK